MRGVLKNIRWYIDIFKCITSIGVYKQAKTHVYRIYAVVKHMETHTDTYTRVYAKVHDYEIWNSKTQAKNIQNKWIPTSICLYGESQWRINKGKKPSVLLCHRYFVAFLCNFVGNLTSDGFCHHFSYRLSHTSPCIEQCCLNYIFKYFAIRMNLCQKYLNAY